MFSTVCPQCGAEDTLAVVLATFVGRIPLTPDGFAFTDAVEATKP